MTDQKGKIKDRKNTDERVKTRNLRNEPKIFGEILASIYKIQYISERVGEERLAV